ncbi:MAG TPA: hypothetical protein VF656_00550, partial [Pyrinomonadaceae bacterium]
MPQRQGQEWGAGELFWFCILQGKRYYIVPKRVNEDGGNTSPRIVLFLVATADRVSQQRRPWGG